MPEIWQTITKNGRTRKILIPHSHNIDGGQLEEIIAWQKEKTEKELDAMPPLPERTKSKEEVGGALNEYTQFLRRKREGTGNKRYF